MYICVCSVLTTATLAASAVALYISALYRPLLYAANRFPEARDWHSAASNVDWVAIAHYVGAGSGALTGLCLSLSSAVAVMHFVHTASLQVLLSLYISLCAPKRMAWFLAGFATSVRLSSPLIVTSVLGCDMYAAISFAAELKAEDILPPMQLSFASLTVTALMLHASATCCIMFWWRVTFGPPGEWSRAITEAHQQNKIGRKSDKDGEKLRKDYENIDDNDLLAYELDMPEKVKSEAPMRQSSDPRSVGPPRQMSKPLRQRSQERSFPRLYQDITAAPPTQEWLNHAVFSRRPALPAYPSRESLPRYSSERPVRPSYRRRRATWDATSVRNGPLPEDDDVSPGLRPLRSATWGPEQFGSERYV